MRSCRKGKKFTPICDVISHCATWLAISCNSTFPDVAATPLREDRPRQCRDLDEQSGIIARGNQGVAKGDHAQIYFRPAAEEVGCGALSQANDACVIAPQGKKGGNPRASAACGFSHAILMPLSPSAGCKRKGARHGRNRRPSDGWGNFVP